MRQILKVNNKNLIDGRKGPVASGAGYDAAETNRYNEDFGISVFTPEQLLMLAARNLRARAQDLERNSDHVRRFLAILENNIIGWSGIRLQSKATRSENTDTPDRPAIKLIESAWREWSEDPTAEGDDSMVEFLTMIVRRWAVDGEIFIETLPGYRNANRFAVRVWESEACPLMFTDVEQRIYNGIRYDAWNRPVAYYFHPSGAGGWHMSADMLVEVPASRCHHLFTRERPRQRRGFTLLCSTAERVHMLKSLEKSVLIGTQVAASKMGFFRDSETGDGSAYKGDGPESDDSYTNVIDVKPGQFEYIGDKQFEAFDVGYPIDNYEPYIHEIIRSAAAGFNISYHLIANDPGSVNYSTAREFRLQDTDEFRRRQYTVCRRVAAPIFESWLRVQLLTSRFSRYTTADFSRLSAVKWQPRGWQWVDPQKEANGNMLAVQMGVKSLTDIAADQGRDYEEVVDQIARDQEYAEKRGVDLSKIWQAVATQEPEINE